MQRTTVTAQAVTSACKARNCPLKTLFHLHISTNKRKQPTGAHVPVLHQPYFSFQLRIIRLTCLWRQSDGRRHHHGLRKGRGGRRGADLVSLHVSRRSCCRNSTRHQNAAALESYARASDGEFPSVSRRRTHSAQPPGCWGRGSAGRLTSVRTAGSSSQAECSQRSPSLASAGLARHPLPGWPAVTRSQQWQLKEKGTRTTRPVAVR